MTFSNTLPTKLLVLLVVLVNLYACARNGLAPVEIGRQNIPVPGNGKPFSQPIQKPSALIPQNNDVKNHAVAEGETLYSIAWRYNVDYLDLAQWNGIAEPYLIHPGQNLVLQQSATLVKPSASTSVAVVNSPAEVGKATNFTKLEVKPITAGSEIGNKLLNSTPPKTILTEKPAQPPTNTLKPKTTSNSKPDTTETPKLVSSIEKSKNTKDQNNSSASRLASGINWLWPAKGRVVNSESLKSGLHIAGQLGDAVTAAAAGEVVYSGEGLVGYGKTVIIKHNDTYLSAYGHNSKLLVKEGVRVSAGQRIAEMGSTGTNQVKLYFEIRRNGKPVTPLNYLPSKT